MKAFAHLISVLDNSELFAAAVALALFALCIVL